MVWLWLFAVTGAVSGVNGQQLFLTKPFPYTKAHTAQEEDAEPASKTPKYMRPESLNPPSSSLYSVAERKMYASRTREEMGLNIAFTIH